MEITEYNVITDEDLGSNLEVIEGLLHVKVEDSLTESDLPISSSQVKNQIQGQVTGQVEGVITTSDLGSTLEMQDDKLEVLVLDEVQESDLPASGTQVQNYVQSETEDVIRTSDIGSNLIIQEDKLEVNVLEEVQESDLPVSQNSVIEYVQGEVQRGVQDLHDYVQSEIEGMEDVVRKGEDIEFSSEEGIVMTSPNGNKFKLSVLDDGTLKTTSLDAEPEEPEEPELTLNAQFDMDNTNVELVNNDIVLTVTGNGELEGLKIHHSYDHYFMENQATQLPWFKVYADEQNPWGDVSSAQQAQGQGVSVTFSGSSETGTWVFTIPEGSMVHNHIVNTGTEMVFYPRLVDTNLLESKSVTLASGFPS